MNNILKKLSIFLIYVLFSMNIDTAYSQPKDLALENKEFTQWMNYYYIHKDSSKTREFLDWLQDTQILKNNKGGVKAVSALLSIIFSDNNVLVKTWLIPTTFTGETKEAIEYALWLSGNSNLILTVFKEYPQYIKSAPVGLLNMDLKQASDIDMMWGAFSASGDERYVKKVIDLLDSQTSLAEDEALIMRLSAEWSLKSNMMQHDLVKRIIVKEASTRSGIVRNKLNQIISSPNED